MKEVEIFTEEHEFGESTILSELEPYPQFVVWIYAERNGRRTKPPINPATGELASPTDPSTWSDLQTAQQALQTGNYEGLGFVFTKNDPFVGVDLDHSVKEDGMLEVWAAEIVLSLNSYTEYSPSKTGLHILTRANISSPGRRTNNTEIYPHGRYFTLSLDHLARTPTAIAARQEETQQLYDSLPPVFSESKQQVVFPHYASDQEVLDKAERAKNGESFRQLYQGSSAGFKSKSEADFTLVLRLLYWCNDDVEQAKRLFRQSGLYDEKTDTMRGDKTYLDYTIENALWKRLHR